MKHFLRKIDAARLFVEDCFWDDGAKDAVVGVPKMDGDVQATDAQGVPLWDIAPVAAVPANPIPADMIATPVPSGFAWPKWDGAQWVEGRDAAEIQAARLNALQDSVVAATQARLDTFAKTRGYDGILSACTYASSAVPQFQVEGARCLALRDATWAALYQILAQVQAGTRPPPVDYAAIEPELPAVGW